VPYYNIKPGTHWRQSATGSATKSTKLATMSTTTSCQIQVVADLSPKPATSRPYWQKSRLCRQESTLSPVLATVDFVANVYWALRASCGYCRCSAMCGCQRQVSSVDKVANELSLNRDIPSGREDFSASSYFLEA